jgi:hypothetical protein
MTHQLPIQLQNQNPAQTSCKAREDAEDRLIFRLAETAMTIVVRTCRREVATADKAQLEAACAAMRARAKTVLGQLIDNVLDAPWIAETAFHAATLDLADAGISSLRQTGQKPGTV